MVIILGMHRSGTSSLAGCLQQQGLYLGKVIEKSPHNPKGNRENPDIMRLNESVLEESGGSWDRPLQRITWNQEQIHERDRIIESYLQQSGKFGFKDPRTLLTLPFWEDSLLPTRYVGTFRHPLLAARSLNARNGMPISQGLALWKEYNRRLLLYYSIDRFPIVSFDVTPREYLLSIDRMASYLNLNKDDTNRNDLFFDESLRKETLDNAAVIPADVMELYERLNAIYREQRS
jgi:hypothetical protein